MGIDVVYVTYNSAKWIHPCFSSWENQPERSSVSVFIADNGSADETLKELEEAELRMGGSFAEFHIYRGEENCGFGAANNIAASHGKSEFLCFLNIDTEVQKDTLEQLFQYIDQSPATVGMWELRQFPFEHPKFYDPVTLETTWASGAAFVIRRKVYEEVGGFDTHFFMYAEDVDLSWKVREAGYKILYCPKALIKHHSYSKRGEIKPLQYGYSMRNNLLMRQRYGTAKDVFQGWILVLKLLLTNQLGWSFNKEFLKIVCGFFRERKYFSPVENNRKEAFFHGLNYSKMRYGAFQETGVITRKSVPIWTFLLSEDPEKTAIVKQCMTNQTVPSKGLNVIKRLPEAAEFLESNADLDGVWINIICEENRVFADHNEFLADMACEDCSVVGTVDENGQRGQNLSYYLFDLTFYQLNKQCFLDDDRAFLAEKCCSCSKTGEKQTVYVEYL